MTYIVPPYTTGKDGHQRRVGFEFEFGDMELETAAELVARSYSGSIKHKSAVDIAVDTPHLGTFTVELDWRLGKKIAEERHTGTDGPKGQGSDSVLRWLKKIAAKIVPIEIACPPIELKKLHLLDIVVEKLRAHGATGTGGSLFYAFGVHMNPEMPNCTNKMIISYLKSFALAQDWLYDKHDVDQTRKLTPFIRPYPREYLDLVLNYPEQVDLDLMIHDYLAHNDTRNRALDMLPLWKHLAPEVVERCGHDDPLTKSRPTLHYRLPDCRIEKEDWYPSIGWNLWCVVEHIAADENLLAELTDLRTGSCTSFPSEHDRTWQSELDRIAVALQSE